MAFDLESDGFERRVGFFDEADLAALEALLPQSNATAGVRIFDNPELANWIVQGALGASARLLLGLDAKPVRAILFDRSVDANWSLDWHQDRTIAVRSVARTPGFENWTTKSGVPHVEPPFCVIESMLTARVHLDAAGASNAPLLVAPNSHRFGKLREASLAATVERCGAVSCLAERGDVWFYRTAILHASDRSRSVARRRVLQLDFSSYELPDGLSWRGVA